MSFSRRGSFQLVFVMQPAEDFSGRDARILGQLLPPSVRRKPLQPFFRVGGDTGTQGRMRTAVQGQITSETKERTERVSNRAGETNHNSGWHKLRLVGKRL